MANLNLSQFGEKLFVADADHTFIWDSAASISKRVSRNSWLNSGTLTADAPVTISQTWGTTGTYTAFKVVATETLGAASASNLLELWSGATPELKFYVSKGGNLSFRAGANFGSISTDGTGRVLINSTNSAGARVTGDLHIGSNDIILLRDGAANTLALRNGTNAQTFNVYGTYTSASVYERLAIRYNGTDLAFQISTQQLGATARPLQLQTDSVTRMHISTAGNVGIGTTAPSEKLHVLGGKVLFGDATDVTGTAGNGDLTLRAWRAPQLNMVANTSSGEAFGLNLKSGIQTLAGITLNIGSGEVKIGGFSTGGYFSTFYSNNAERMRIDTAGNLGIGTTSPTSKLHVAGEAFLAVNGSNTAPSLRIGAGANINGWYSFGGVQLNGVVNSVNVLGIASGGINVAVGNITLGNAADVILEREAQDELALRRATNGQKFSVYGTYPGAAWERFTITAPTSGNVLLGTYKGTGGIARGLELQTDGVTRITLGTTEITTTVPFTVSGLGRFVGVQLGTSGSSRLVSPGYGIATFLDSDGTGNFTKLNLAGNTDSFPSLKRSTTRIQAVLATTDTTFTNIQGKLTTDTDYTAGSISPTGFLTLYDAQGNAYKVPCVAA